MGDDVAAITGLGNAASRARSSRLRQAIGYQADAIASRLLSAGPDSSPELSAVGRKAAQFAEQMLPIGVVHRPSLAPTWFSSDDPWQ